MKKILAIMLFVFSAALCLAENVTVRGVIRDVRGEAVIGAYVTLESNTNYGAVADLDGKYTLTFPASPNARLVFACLGFDTKTVAVQGRTVIDVVLEEINRELDEAVVVGYGSMKRSDLTGSVTSVKVEESAAARSNSLDQLLQGHAAGVRVVANSSAPDAGVSITIRGSSTFNGSTEPLYVVDGILINTSASSGSISTMGSEESNGLMGLNPQDIASIEILKDASATAIYGSQGANGVVLITTKEAKSDKPSFSFNAGIDFGRANKHIDMLDMDGYADLATEIGMVSVLSGMYTNPSTREGLKVTPVDWQDYTLRTAVSNRWYFSVSAHPKKTSYLFSVGYNQKQGIVKNTDVQQLTLRLNLDRTLGKNVKIGSKTSVAYVFSNMTQGANASSISSGASMLRSMLSYRPFISSDIDIDEESWIVDPDDNDTSVGPNRWFRFFKSTRSQISITPSLYATIKLTPWLSFKTTMGANFQVTETDKFKSRKISVNYGSTGGTSTGFKSRVNMDNMFLFEKKVGLSSLSGTVGSTINYSNSATQSVSAWYLEQDAAIFESLNGSVSPYNSMSYSETENSIFSVLARGVYDYHSRYVLTATFRADGSSRFQGKNKWAYFPSVAAAWRISQERWFRVDAISSAKLRLGWGRVGNQGIPSYRTLPLYATDNVADHTESNLSGIQTGSHISYISNPDLKWETSEQANAGLDIGLFKGRISMALDVYDKNTKDLLQSKNIARTSGFSSMWVNQGDVNNRGLEFSLETVPVKSRNFEWYLSGNISFNRNRITNIGSDIQTEEIYITPDNKQLCNFFYGSTVRSSTATTSILNIFVEGQPMGLFYGFLTDGIVQVGEEWPTIGSDRGAYADPGDVKYVDVNGDGCINEYDRTIIGDPNPKFTYGFNTSFTLKNFNLSADFNGVFGNSIYNYNLYADLNTNPTTYTLRNVRSEAYTDAWRMNNPSNVHPRLKYDDELLSDRFVEDGSFLRLATLSASYSIKAKNKNAAVKGVTLGVTVGNVFVLTNYSQWDPEVNSYGSDITRLGIDAGSYPAQRTFSFDAKFKF